MRNPTEPVSAAILYDMYKENRRLNVKGLTQGENAQLLTQMVEYGWTGQGLRRWLTDSLCL